jgi:hypothetical protein
LIRRGYGPNYNSRALIDACNPFKWMVQFPQTAEFSPKYIANFSKKERQIFLRETGLDRH